MRINKFVASCSGLSRRAADQAIADGRVQVNRQPPSTGYDVQSTDVVTLDGNILSVPKQTTTIVFNKPAGYVVSREGQGNRTIYELLPENLHHLKPVGRLDKDSSGLLLLTNDGELANRLTHPRYQKQKVYQVTLNKDLQASDQRAIQHGVELADGPSTLGLQGHGSRWTVTMSEGRNRQIRRTFEQLGYRVITLHRTHFGDYSLNKLALAKFSILP